MRHNSTGQTEREWPTGLGQPETESTTLVGDGYDAEQLLTVGQVADLIAVSRQEVYRLDIPRVRIRKRSLRWRPSDVRAWIESRLETV